MKTWPGDRDSNPGRCDPQRFSRPPLSTTQPSPEKEANCWRRHPDSNRGSGLCRPVPYHLAMSPYSAWRRHPELNTGITALHGRCLSTWLYRHAKNMVPGAGLEPARTNVRGILSPLRLPIPPSGQEIDSVALLSHTLLNTKNMERETGVEPATPTLARSCSTTELLPHILGWVL